MSKLGGWLRRPLKAWVAALARVRSRPCPPSPRNILVVRDGGLGDLVLTVPIIRTIRQHFGPEVTVDALVRRQTAAFYRNFDQIDTLWTQMSYLPTAVRTIQSMRRRRYDLVIDLVLSPSLSFALWVLWAAPGAHRVGGDKRELKSVYHQHVDLPPRSSINFLERLRRIGAQAFGDTALVDDTPWIDWPSDVIEQVDSVWRAVIGDKTDAVVVLINVSAGIAARTWPDEKYQELLRWLLDTYGDQVDRWLITAAPHEHARAVNLASYGNHPAVMALPKVSDFRVVAALVGRATAVITPDTSIVHCCSAHGTPVLVLTVTANKTTWAPWNVDYETVAAAAGQPVSSIECNTVSEHFTKLWTRMAQRQKQSSHRSS